MPLADTIERAAEIAGSQTALAKLIDVTPQNLSDIKKGKRACGLKKRIQIAEIAGVDRLRTIFEYFEDSLDSSDEYELQAKQTLRAVLEAFPSETDEAPETKKPLQVKNLQGQSWRKRKFLTLFKAPGSPGFFSLISNLNVLVF